MSKTNRKTNQKIDQTRLWFSNQTKKELIKSIKPLQKKYFILFVIWQIEYYSFQNLYRFILRRHYDVLRFMTMDRARLIQRTQRRSWQIIRFLATPKMAGVIIGSFIGTLQILKKYMGISAFGILTINMFAYKTQIGTHNWKTFHIADTPYFLKRRPVTYLYKKIHLLNKDRPIAVTITPYAQNRRNQLHFGFILLDKVNKQDSNKVYNRFKISRYPVYLPQSHFNVFDAIPKKMEGARQPSYAYSRLFRDSREIYKLNWPLSNQTNNIKLAENELERWQIPNKHLKKNPILLKNVSKNTPFTKKLLFKELSYRHRFTRERSFFKDTQKFLRSLHFIAKLEGERFDYPKNLSPKIFQPQFTSEDFVRLEQARLRERLTTFRVTVKDGVCIIKDCEYAEQLPLSKKLKKHIYRAPKPELAEEQIAKGVKNLYKQLYIDAFKEMFRKQYEEELMRKAPPIYIKVKKALKDPNFDLQYYEKVLKEFKYGINSEGLRPRLCSGYQYPDIEQIKGQISIATKPKTIKAVLPMKYRKVLIQRLLRVFKNKDLVVYPTVQKIGSNMPEYRKAIKVFTNYKSNTFMELGQPDAVRMFLTKKVSRIKNKPYRMVFEETSSYSWLIVSKAGIYFIGYLIFQYIYQKHGKEFVVSLIDLVCLIGFIEDGEFLKEELNLENVEKNYRAVRKVKGKYFDELVGVENLLCDLNNSFWHLQNKNKPFIKFIRPLMKENRIFAELAPILLLGPPGTGKTAFVHAFATESEVPVLIQSGGVLKNFTTRGKGAKSIRALFNRARRVSPCVVFIDEVDSIGTRRSGMSRGNILGRQDSVDIVTDPELTPVTLDDVNNFFTESELMDIDELDEKLEKAEEVQFGETLLDAQERREKKLEILQEMVIKRKKQANQLAMLTQLLIELDGLNPINDILVFGATNRSYVLDPALVRSGRFARIYELTLPSYERRIQIIKRYIGFRGEMTIESKYWNYIAQRLEGLSSADVSTIANESSLISWAKSKPHSIRSIEQGIERVTTFRPVIYRLSQILKYYMVILSARHRWFINKFYMKHYKLRRSKKRLKLIKNHAPLFTNLKNVKEYIATTKWKTFSYQAAGRAIIETVLPSHPSCVYFDIQRRYKNFRYEAIDNLLLNFMQHIKYRADFEARLTSLMAGKATQYLVESSLIDRLEGINRTNQNDLGKREIIAANLLSFLMVDRWYLYGHRVCIFQNHPLLQALNVYEYHPDEITYFDAIVEDKTVEIREKNRLIAKGQKRSYPTWWVKQIMEQESLFDRIFMKWYRIYLPETEEDERNIEWCPPEDHFTAMDFKGVLSILYWEKVLTLMYDHLHQSLIFNSLNAGYTLLANNRELLDYLVSFALVHEKVREPHLKLLMQPFLDRDYNKTIINSKLFGFKNLNGEEEEIALARNWGSFSRRKTSYTLNLQQIKECSIAPNQPDQEMIDLFAKLEIDHCYLKHLSGFGPNIDPEEPPETGSEEPPETGSEEPPETGSEEPPETGSEEPPEID